VDVSDALNAPGDGFARMIGPRRERELLDKLADSKRVLTDTLIRGQEPSASERTDDPRAMSRLIAEAYRELGSHKGPRAAAFRRYFDLRTELALANARLVAHVAKRYRDRGVAYADLLQEGFCGLLEAIDRFDLSHETKLSTYATWWIRQSIQSAIASGAYPVRLAPRNLRVLARCEERHAEERPGDPGRHTAAESVQRIRAATRPAISLDKVHPGVLSPLGDPTRDQAEQHERQEVVGTWMESLRPRQRQVVSYRFGLGGGPPLSLRQVGEMLNVSKERVRQIQDAALKSLRAKASHGPMTPAEQRLWEVQIPVKSAR
jgi:RNA polymerase primary sigma factor